MVSRSLAVEISGSDTCKRVLPSMVGDNFAINPSGCVRVNAAAARPRRADDRRALTPRRAKRTHHLVMGGAHQNPAVAQKVSPCPRIMSS
jgi:hypothetical protein